MNHSKQVEQLRQKLVTNSVRTEDQDEELFSMQDAEEADEETFEDAYEEADEESDEEADEADEAEEEEEEEPTPEEKAVMATEDAYLLVDCQDKYRCRIVLESELSFHSVRVSRSKLEMAQSITRSETRGVIKTPIATKVVKKLIYNDPDTGACLLGTDCVVVATASKKIKVGFTYHVGDDENATEWQRSNSYAKAFKKMMKASIKENCKQKALKATEVQAHSDAVCESLHVIKATQRKVQSVDEKKTKKAKNALTSMDLLEVLPLESDAMTHAFNDRKKPMPKRARDDEVQQIFEPCTPQPKKRTQKKVK